MPDRRGRKGRSVDLLPDDRLRWAREIWAAREACARTEAVHKLLDYHHPQ